MTRLKKKRLIATLALGIAVVPATAMAATDAIPGDPFKLGQENRISTETTALTGVDQNGRAAFQVRKDSGASGPAVKIENAAAGVAQPGLLIRTRPGQSPIQVNGDAGKANGFNADKLDGLSSTDFLQPRIYSNGTPTLIDGPGGGKTLLLHALNANLDCDTGDIALSAGGNAVDADDDLNGVTPFRESYQIEFQDNGAPGKFSANIICLDAAQPFRG